MVSDSKSFESSDAAFAYAFKAARTGRGLTQDFVAQIMSEQGFKWHQATVYKVELGQRKVTVGEALALADMVGTPLDVLADPDPESPRSLRNEVNRSGRRFAESLFDAALAANNARHDRWLFAVAVSAYDRGLSVGTVEDGETVREHFWPLLAHTAPGDFMIAWQEVTSDPRLLAIFDELDYPLDPEEINFDMALE